jgi:hypothetical protein
VSKYVPGDGRTGMRYLDTSQLHNGLREDWGLCRKGDTPKYLGEIELGIGCMRVSLQLYHRRLSMVQLPSSPGSAEEILRHSRISNQLARTNVDGELGT